ncbi:hypothetical protein [Flavobacterium phragmitis]|uniref:Uncharacterized protein n=1 Tax=Flavobacterium phragmitis TaxID=739143 RepID=A0A1I1RTG3_9FLAO|nr:hypothetical protein [Flavobacterium phragmitis]SFD37656.1 hypothetical protein SAMN05216297_107153 [Flavobacterium phragmitis]
MALYKWKNFADDSQYSTSAIEECELSFQDLLPEISSVVKPFFAHHQKAEIPTKNKKLLVDLLALNILDISLQQFITIGCALQSQWNSALTMYEDDDLVRDFDLEKENYKSLFDVLEKFLFAENYRDLHSLSFKSSFSGTTTVNNFFVLRDLYEAICLGYDIKKENFEERKAEILSMTNQVRLPKLGEKIKIDYARTLYNAIESKFDKGADTLRFIGAFFHIFQVPTNNSQTLELLYDNISDTLESIDIKNFRHYLTHRPSIFHV